MFGTKPQSINRSLHFAQSISLGKSVFFCVCLCLCVLISIRFDFLGHSNKQERDSLDNQTINSNQTKALKGTEMCREKKKEGIVKIVQIGNILSNVLFCVIVLFLLFQCTAKKIKTFLVCFRRVKTYKINKQKRNGFRMLQS